MKAECRSAGHKDSLHGLSHKFENRSRDFQICTLEIQICNQVGKFQWWHSWGRCSWALHLQHNPSVNVAGGTLTQDSEGNCPHLLMGSSYNRAQAEGWCRLPPWSVGLFGDLLLTHRMSYKWQDSSPMVISQETIHVHLTGDLLSWWFWCCQWLCLSDQMTQNQRQIAITCQ